ncbi:MAG: pilin [Candidatus Paceibacterota bacterium]|jgi:hypothetical protein
MFKIKFTKKTILLLTVFIVLSAIVFDWNSGQVSAATEKCEPGPWTCSHSYSDPYRCDEFDVYRCTNNSCGNEGGAIEQGQKFFMCVTHSWACSNECYSRDYSNTYHVSGPYDPDSIEPYDGEVPDYHICPTQYNNWNKDVPITECRGMCYPAPIPNPLDDPSLEPKNQLDETGYKLPVNFGWDDLTEIVSEPENYCTVGSYQFYIATTTSDNASGTTKIVSGNQLQEITDSAYKLQCELETGKEHQWKVKGCLDADGVDCGEWSELQNMTTSYSPELYSPFDPDWGGDEAGHPTQEEISSLKWCEMEDTEYYQEKYFDGKTYYKPLSFKVLVYYSETDECHDQLYKFGECQPKLLTAPQIPVPREGLPPNELVDNGYFFTKNTVYAWKVAACIDKDGHDCTEYSPLWRFNTGSWDLGTVLSSPPDDTIVPVGLPVSLGWSSPGSNSFKYKVTGLTSGTTNNLNISLDYPQLSLNTVYEWSIQACSDYETKECEGSWGGPWRFRTTGKAPELNSFLGDESIPVTFSWQEVGGAKSYILHVFGQGLDKEIKTKGTSAALGYPDLKQELSYSWRVRTCADEEGNICGEYSGSKPLTTLRMSGPRNTYPENEGKIYTEQRTHVVRWSKVRGGDYYQYQVSYVNPSAEEENEECYPKAIIPETITDQDGSTLLNLKCLGDYEWKVRACIDENCQEAGDWSDTYKFSLIMGENPERESGLVPCGRTQDNIDTSWDERDACQFKHIFLLIRNIIDFILWQFAPLMLGILVLGTGLMFFFSIRFQEPLFLAKMKAVWRSAGIGYGILFLSWTILNLFLMLIGFDIGVFGEWWKF